MNRPRRLCSLTAAVVLGAGGLLGACSGDDGATPDSTATGGVDRQAVVTEVVDTVIAPLVRQAADAATAATSATEAYCEGPTAATEAAAVDAVDVALHAYERLDPVDMGPIMVRRTDGHVAYPVDTARVEEHLADDPPTDAESIDSRTPSSVRGLTTAAYLLAATPGPGADPGRCEYLVAITANAAYALDLVAADSFEGSADEPAYYPRLTGEGADAEPPKETVDVIVNMVMSVLDTDAGLLADPGDQPEATVRSAADAHLATVAALWGDGTTGLSRLADDGELAARMADEVAAAEAALDDPGVDAAGARAAVEEVRATLGTEVVAALDVVVGFSENDGDS